MRRIYTASDIVQVGRVRSLLESEGIVCQVRNEYVSGALGGLPFDQTWPELWVAEDDADRAERLIARERFTPLGGEDWTCPDCKETVETPLTQCWNCGKEQD